MGEYTWRELAAMLMQAQGKIMQRADFELAVEANDELSKELQFCADLVKKS